MPNGFQEILDRWRSQGKAAHADYVVRALACLNAACPQFFQNLAEDPHAGVKREELLEQLRLCDPDDVILVKERVIWFCRLHQAKGPRNHTAEGAQLGHVEDRHKIEITMSSNRCPKSPLAHKRHSGIPLSVDKLLAKDLAGQKKMLKNCLLSQRLMWSFYQPRSLDAPFGGVAKNPSELVRRLGLRQADPPQELLLWEHRLQPPQTAHKPTAYDAADNEFFRPGGKTQPLSGDGGLHEVVHMPVTADQLAARIEKAG